MPDVRDDVRREGVPFDPDQFAALLGFRVHRFTTPALRGQEKSLQDIDVGLPSLAEGMESLVAVLRQHGLVEATIVDWKGWQDFIARAVSDGPMTGPPEDSIKVTTLGHLVLERYRKA